MIQENKLSKVAICVGFALTSSSAMAANSWLSRVNTVTEQQEKSIVSANHMQAVSAMSSDSSNAVFDITVSLYNNPKGNEQKVYEEILGYFADGVCEQSNGEHKLGKISIFRENKHRSKSDIIWGDREWPRANTAGFGANGMHIWFGDVFPNGAGQGKDHNMLTDPLGAGYTLAHEWGHYAYGVYDEYKGNAVSGAANATLTTDVATDSIMSNQWQARNGDMKWLNHSTANNIGDVNRTAQGRVYGKSAWEVLTQDVKDDPKSGRKTAQPTRTRYTTLANNAPDASNPVKTELPAAQSSCRDQLKFVWVEGDIDMQIVMDRSGSMYGSPINNAIQAAKTLVDATAEGSTAMGLVSFSSRSSVKQDFAVQQIPKPDTGIKQALKAAIDNIYASGSTALFDGSSLALDNLITYQTAAASGAPGVVFVLADGDDNSSIKNESTVITAYQNANVPIFSFGYGSASPTGPLVTMANATGGKYFSSPTTLSEIIDAFLQANAIATDNQNLVSSTVNVANDASATQEIHIDSGLDNVNIFVNHKGSASDLQLTLKDASGNNVAGVSFDCVTVTGGQSCNVNVPNSVIASLGHGEWQLELTNTNVNRPLDATVNVSAEPSLAGSYTVSVEGFAGNAVTYPSPMILTTALTKDKLITGANVLATIKDPMGNTTNLEMFDNGQGGDAVAGDGIYSAVAPYNQNGIYQVEVNVDNKDSKARYTATGLFTPTLDGSEPVQEALPTITENFVRIAKTSLVVSDVPYYDGDDSHYIATKLETTNAGINGVIDSAGDLDFYVLENIDMSKDLVVRVTDASLGMKPKLTVYKPDASTAIVDNVTLATNPSATNYVFSKLAKSELESTLYVVVSHEDDTAATGGYQVSAGEPLNTDVPPNNVPVANSDAMTIWAGQKVTISPLANDTDADGDTLVIDSVTTGATKGAVAVSGNIISYDSGSAFANETPGSTVLDSFAYIITDNKGGFAEATVDVSVKINTPPTATPDAISVNENATVTISPLTNDTDADGHTFTLSAKQASLKGKLTDNGDGTFIYDPNGQFNDLVKGETANEVFSYTITDKIGATSTTEVTISVVGINAAPVAVADTAVTTKSGSIQIDLLANDTDADGDTLTITAIDVGSLKGKVTNNNDGTVTYSPNGQFGHLYQGQSATETFTYIISDGDAEMTASVTVTINGEGQAPVEPEKEGSSGGSLSWFVLLLAPLAFMRRRVK